LNLSKEHKIAGRETVKSTSIHGGFMSIRKVVKKVEGRNAAPLRNMGNKPMSVLMIAPSYGMKDRGGVAVAVENLVCGLRGAGMRSHVLVPIGDGWLPRCERGTSGECIFYLPMRARSESEGRLKSLLGYWLRLPFAWLVMSFLLVAGRCRIVHFHYCAEEYDDLRRIVRRFQSRIVTTFHGSDIAIAADEEPMRAAIRRMVADSMMVTTCSNDLLRQLLRKIPESTAKSTAILNAVHMSFMKAARECSLPPQSDIDVLYVGALRHVKGPDVLLEAFVEIVKLRPEARLCIVGVGDMEGDLRRKVASEGLEANVVLAGSVAHVDLVEYYARTKLVVVPSRSEGLGNVAIEAAIMGKPVIATDVGGLREVVAENESGLVVPANDPSELARAILSLLQDAKLSTKLGKQAKTRAIKLFDPGAMAERFVQLYGEVCVA
jgi:glycosyltransferase involved in cell wall biosynthesis